MIKLAKASRKHPECNIVNFDESNWRLVMADEQVVGERGAELVRNYIDGDAKANFSFFASICADGTRLPPILIARGKMQRCRQQFHDAGLEPHQKQIRVQMAIDLLQVLSVQSTHQWHDIVTLDESWIDLFSEHDLMWTALGEIVVDREWHTVQSPKFTLTVVWNPIEFHALKALPKGRKFNAQYYTNGILVAISDWRRQTGGTRPNKLWVHSDNARPHTAKMLRDYIGLNQIKQVPHPSCSPDLAPSAFSLLDTSKES
jgi:hypothetical protein